MISKKKKIMSSNFILNLSCRESLKYILNNLIYLWFNSYISLDETNYTEVLNITW